VLEIGSEFGPIELNGALKTPIGSEFGLIELNGGLKTPIGSEFGLIELTDLAYKGASGPNRGTGY
jgi:hypothetical protein